MTEGAVGNVKVSGRLWITSGGENRTGKGRKDKQRVRQIGECVYVPSVLYVAAENLFKIFPKSSKLKKNTNFMLDYDLIGLERSS